MRDDQLDEAGLIDFEQQLKSLVPRPPQKALLEFDQSGNQLLVPRRAFYRTVAISASLGALVGAACTLLILRTDVGANMEATLTTPTSHTLMDPITELTAAAEDLPSSTDNALANVSAKSESAFSDPTSDQGPYWFDHLAELPPGTLGLGTRLVSSTRRPQDVMQKFGQRETTTTGEAWLEPSVADLDNNSIPPYCVAPVLPQREWMRLLLSCPKEIF